MEEGWDLECINCKGIFLDVGYIVFKLYLGDGIMLLLNSYVIESLLV